MESPNIKGLAEGSAPTQQEVLDYKKSFSLDKEERPKSQLSLGVENVSKKNGQDFFLSSIDESEAENTRGVDNQNDE